MAHHNSSTPILKSLSRTTIILAFIALGFNAFPQAAKRLKPYVAENKLYALQKPAEWKVEETNEPARLRVQVLAPDGTAAVDFLWERNNRRSVNAVQYLLTYRQLLRKSLPDIVFSDVHASEDKRRCAATAVFHKGQTAMRGRYYFESSPQSLSVQGYYMPSAVFSSNHSLLVNIMASMAFLKKDPKPEPAAGRPEYYRPPMNQRRANDGSLIITIPADWEFLAAGGKIITSSPKSAPGFAFTSLQGNPMVRNAPIDSGVISSRYLNPQQSLVYVLQALGQRDVRVDSSVPDPSTVRELAANTGARGDAQNITASWISSKGVACVGGFKVTNTLPSMTGIWTTMISGVWAPQQDTYLYLEALEKIASSFSINNSYAKAYILAGLRRLRDLQRETAGKINDLNRQREKNQRDWEDRQRSQEFSQSKWDDYRRGNSYWVSDIEGGKVYAADSWVTRDTVTGDYYEGRPYNYTNFEGENPRYNESMREISSYELEHIGNR